MKKEENQNWLREGVRDIISLGGIPFFLIVLVRVNMLNKPEYFSQFVIAGVLFLVLMVLLKADLYAGLGLIVVFFTSLYYNDLQFTIFAAILYVLAVGALFYLKYGTARIIKGIVLGVLSTGIAWWVVKRLMFG